MSEGIIAFGEAIRRQRQERGLTVRDLAARVGCTPAYISRVETRGELPSPQLICLLAEKLGIAPERLLEAARKDRVGRMDRELAAKHHEALSVFRREK